MPAEAACQRHQGPDQKVGRSSSVRAALGLAATLVFLGVELTLGGCKRVTRPLPRRHDFTSPKSCSSGAARRRCHPQPSPGAQCRDPHHGARVADQLDAWRDDGGHPRSRHRGGRPRVLGRRRPAPGLRSRPRRTTGGSPDFWREEYALNAIIKRYRKPYVALLDGIVMGGGVGVSVHGSHRVAGDNFMFAMPEVGIGFFPDVGATWFLPRMPGEIGTYCALTGERLKAADALAAGVATHRVASSRFPELLDALCGTAPVDAILAPSRNRRAEQIALAHRPIACSRAIRSRTSWPRLTLRPRRRLVPLHRRHHSVAIADQLEDGAGAGAARQDVVVRGVHAGGISHRVAGRLRSRLLRRRARGDHRQGQRAAMATGRPAAVSVAEVERYFAPLERELRCHERSAAATKPAKQFACQARSRRRRATARAGQTDEHHAVDRASRPVPAGNGGVSLLKGLYHWAEVCGIGVGPRAGLKRRPWHGRPRRYSSPSSISSRRSDCGLRRLGRGRVAHVSGVDGGGRVVFPANLRRQI